MAQVTGLVQQVKYTPVLDVAFIWFGPTSSNTVLYYVLMSDSDDPAVTAVKSTMVDALTAAMFNRRTVVLNTDSVSSSPINLATINPV